ncbi:MAG: succinate dehydrogenase/fumarate reductase transmembrane subunit [Myxococcaceae bacterium]
MAEAAAGVETTNAGKGDYSFLLRRLHSLSGLVPIGAFLCFHLFENLNALKGAAAYSEGVQHLNAMLPRPYFLAIELSLIAVPLLFHGVYGLTIAGTGKANYARYVYSSNLAYWVQRISGYVAFVYLLVHVGVLRVIVTLNGQHLARYHGPTGGRLNLITYEDVAAHFGNPRHQLYDTWLSGNHMLVFYAVGTVAAIWHFTNGLNGFAWTWGLAVGRVAQRRVRMIAWGLFVVLTFACLNVLFSMRFA